MTSTLDLPSLVLYRDADILVLNKPAGLVVHRTPRAGVTLEDALDQLRFGLPRLPRLAHRLDRDTSGCLVLGRHPAALRTLNQLFATGAVEKTYWAIVEGVPAAAAGRIELPLLKVHRAGTWSIIVDPAGQQATTGWRVLGRQGDRSWLELRPETGRTHQLRVHCAQSGWPIVGDSRYGQTRRPSESLQLHAARVRVPWRRSTIDVAAPAPGPMTTTLAAFAVGNLGEFDDSRGVVTGHPTLVASG